MEFSAEVKSIDGKLTVAFPSALLDTIGSGDGTMLIAVAVPGHNVFAIGTASDLQTLFNRLHSLGFGITIG